jgi:excisionase family DNA binding protein
MSRISLAEAATVLGKSERQVRYMIKNGRLKAVKIGGRWVVESTDLPLTDDQRQAMAHRVDAARAAFERGVAPAERVAQAEKKRHYSVLDLDTFSLGLELYREIRGVIGNDQPAAAHMFECLRELTAGCHDFHPKDKSSHFAAARGECTGALVHLLVAAADADDDGPVSALAARLEQELIPKVSSLIAGQERRRHRG